MSIARRLGPFIGLVGANALVVRPRMLRWGSTDAEADRAYPGADLIPGGERTATMAVTIEAPPARVWPWLVQMGTDRAGWYSCAAQAERARVLRHSRSGENIEQENERDQKRSLERRGDEQADKYADSEVDHGKSQDGGGRVPLVDDAGTQHERDETSGARDDRVRVRAFTV